MFIFGNLILAVAEILSILLKVFWWLIFIRVILSWVNPDPFNVIVQFLYRTTEPILEPIRRFLPPMGLDISPIIVFLLIIGLQIFLIPSLVQIGYRLQF